MANIQYYSNVNWDNNIKEVGTDESGLAIDAIAITAGAPAATSRHWIPGAIVQNQVDGLLYRNAGSTVTPSWVIVGGGSFSLPITTVLSSGTATYDQTNNFLGLGIPGAGQFLDTGTGGYNMLVSLDTTAFGGSPDTTIVGYLSVGGGANTNTQYSYNSSTDESNIQIKAGSLANKQAEIRVKANSTTPSIGYYFNGGNSYSFPITSPAAGQVLGYVSANQLGWVTAGGSTTPGGSNTYVQYNDSGAFGGDSNFVWNKTSKVFSVGDIGNTSNKMKFIVNDSSFQTTAVLGFGGNFNIQDSTGAISFITSYGQTVSLGDISNVGFKNKISVYDSAQNIEVVASNQFQITDELSNRWLQLIDNASSKIIRFGDISSAHNSTKVQIDDFAKQVFVQTDGDFGVQNVFGGRAIDVNFSGGNNFVVQTGDVNGLLNSTKFLVDDPNRVITATADLHFIVQKVNGDDWFDVSTTSDKVSMGDLAGTANGTKFVVDDGNQLIQSYSSNVNKNVLVGRAKVLTNNTVTSVFEVALPSGGMTGGFFTVTITATDNTDFQSHSDHVTYSAVNKGGSYTTAIQASNGDDAVALSSGTLAVTWSMTTGTDKVIIQVNANSSLTTTSVKIEGLNIDNNNGHVVTIL